MLLQLVEGAEKISWLAIGKKVGKPPGECAEMHRMLTGYAQLGETKIVVENGLRVTKCPPAYARGVWPQRNVNTF